MKELELFSLLTNVKSAYILQAQALRSDKKRAEIRRLSRKRGLLLAAVISLLLLLVGCAAVLLQLQKVNLGHMSFSDMLWMEPRTYEKDVLSLTGYTDSPQYRATQEWMEFTHSYDTDGTLLRKADADGYIAPPDYSAYPCYTEEMCAKVDALCEKYGLSLAGPAYFPATGDEVLAAVGVRSIARSEGALSLNAGRFYPGGSFQMEGNVEHRFYTGTDVATVSFYYLCTQKNVFFTVYLTTDDIASFDSWEYTAWDGTKLLLAQNGERGLIFADTEDCFISVTLYYSLVETGAVSNPCAREELEQIADAFAYTIAPRQPGEQRSGDSTIGTVQDGIDPELVYNKDAWEAGILRVLMNQEEFYASELQKFYSLTDYCHMTAARIEMPVTVVRCAMVDMDGDGIREGIVDFKYGREAQVACMVLHEHNGTVFGMEFSYRQMFQIKADGSFFRSGSAADSGWARPRFDDGFTVVPAENGEGKADLQWRAYPLTADMRDDASFTLFREVFLPIAGSRSAVREEQVKTLCQPWGFYHDPYPSSILITMPGSMITGFQKDGVLCDLTFTLYLSPADEEAAPYSDTLEVGVEQLNEEVHRYFIYRRHTTPIEVPSAEDLAEYINWHRVHPRDAYTNWDPSLIVY